MKTQLIMPQEIEVFYIIPAIRRGMALVMKEKGKKQKEIAKLVCVKESTVSQYINDKRAHEIKFSDKVRKAVAASASKITDRVSLIRETLILTELVKKDTVLCGLHQSIANVPKSCDVCLKR